jgi:nitronate monooxygenase
MIPDGWRDRLRLPVIAAPMTDVSGPELVAAACAAGVIGSFPTHNAADGREVERWLERIAIAIELEGCGCAAPIAANLVVHRSNARLIDDLRAVVRGGVEVVITSVGSPAEIIEPLHDAGIIVLSDVASLRHADQAIACGVDGLVLLTAGAGGQTGWANPLAFLRAVRQRYDGVVVLAGGVSDGAGILAARALGADLAYLGTRFIATTESAATAEYRAAVVNATLDDITASTQVSGLIANVLTEWLRNGGGSAAEPESASFSLERMLSQRGVWAAGHSVSGADEVVDTAQLVHRLEREFDDAIQRLVPVAVGNSWRS